MTRYLPQAVLVFAALISVFIAARAFTVPAALASRLGMVVSTPDGINEVRAQYGGFYLAVALACVLSLMGTVSHRTALTVLIVVFGGILFGRIASLPLDSGFKNYGALIRQLFVIDTLGLALASAALLTGTNT